MANTSNTENSSEPAHRDRRPLILVAEDDDDFRDYVCTILGKGAYEFMSVGDGAAAMDYIDTALLDPMSSHLPDLLITDLQMPHCNGMKVLAYTKFLPTIAMTAFGDSATHAEARRCGANFVFDKPLDVRKLRAVVDNLVHSPGTWIMLADPQDEQ